MATSAHISHSWRQGWTRTCDNEEPWSRPDIAQQHKIERLERENQVLKAMLGSAARPSQKF
ncbi:hypothetical protein V8F06_004178 [Rhypophila decipiens]